MNEDFIAGKNPVIEALKSGRSINKIMIAKKNNSDFFKKILKEASTKKIPVQKVATSKLDDISQGENHQGIVAFAAAKDYVELEDLILKSKNSQNGFIVILDGLKDPHNLGAIIRTAEAVGCSGIVIPKRRSVALNQTVAKTSAGAVEYVPVSRVSNISMTIEKLKNSGFWIVGCEAAGNELIYNIDLKGHIAVVIGSEGKGLSKLTAEKCDFLAKIPMKGELNSLNASVAASIVMYEVIRQRLGAEKV